MALKSLLSESVLTLTASHVYFEEISMVSAATLVLSAGVIEFKDFELTGEGTALFDTIESNPVAFLSQPGGAITADGFTFIFNTHNLDPVDTVGSGGGGGGDLTDGDYGDLTVGGTGTTMTINPDAVTNAKLANMATLTLKGNNTGGSANPTDLSVADVKTMLNLAGTNSGDQTSIVGITGTLAEFNAALTGADFATGGGTASGTNTGDQTTIVGITGTLAEFNAALTGADFATGGGTATGTNTGDQNVFSKIAVSGQSDVDADTTSDTLTLVAGSNVTITTSGDSITISAATSGGSTLADGDYGDVTASSSGTVITIDADVVTNAKLANMATATFKGRTTAGTGDPEDLSVSQAKTLLDLSGTNTGDQTITLTSDVTGSGSGSFATTIANNAVTNAKAADMAANTLKGNNTGSSADPADLTVAQVKTLLAYTASDVGAQAADATLTAWAAFNSNGILVQTALDTFAARTITGTANQVDVANGNGSGGNPTLTLSSTVVVPGTVQFPQSGLLLRDTDNTHNVIVSAGSNLSANRTFTLTTGDANRTLTMTGDATISGTNTGDQTITLTGHVTGSGTGSFATTIAAGVVTNAMLADVATATFKGRTTAGTGSPEDLSVAQAKTLLNLTGTNSGDQNLFSTIAVSGQSNVVADTTSDTLTLIAGTNITITTNATNDEITINATGGGSTDSFKTIQVSGQSDVVADSSTDTLTLVAGSNITITTNATTDEITISATGGGGGNSFETIAVSGQTNVVADSSTDTLTLVAGEGMIIETTAGSDTITFTTMPRSPVIDNSRETSTTTGTGDLTLAGASGDAQTIQTGRGLNTWFEYAIINRANSEFEIGLGYLSNGTTLVRSRVFESSNSKALVNFSAGTKDVFLTVSFGVLDTFNARVQAAPYIWR